MPTKKKKAKKKAKKTAKKATKKKTVKKTKTKAKKTAKKKAKKRASTQAKRKHPKAPAEKYFVMVDGRRLANVKQLADTLDLIEDHVFHYHVTADRNDFATWIKDVFADIELAKKLIGVTDRKQAQIILYKHITHKLW